VSINLTILGISFVSLKKSLAFLIRLVSRYIK
jgi:Na+-transporting methylmalonyl-CoA/oxaloacetate decarboxylase gamma subunit